MLSVADLGHPAECAGHWIPCFVGSRYGLPALRARPAVFFAYNEALTVAGQQERSKRVYGLCCLLESADELRRLQVYRRQVADRSP